MSKQQQLNKAFFVFTSGMNETQTHDRQCREFPKVNTCSQCDNFTFALEALNLIVSLCPFCMKSAFSKDLLKLRKARHVVGKTPTLSQNYSKAI